VAHSLGGATAVSTPHEVSAENGFRFVRCSAALSTALLTALSRLFHRLFKSSSNGYSNGSINGSRRQVSAENGFRFVRCSAAGSFNGSLGARITALSLPENTLDGTVPTSIGVLSEVC
jgi:hypothetical protein